MKPNEAMDIVRQTMERVRNLKEFTVIINKPEDWEFKLPCPFDVKTRAASDQLECRVLALTMKEAKKIVMEHYGI
jgi:hypothetical protein